MSLYLSIYLPILDVYRVYLLNVIFTIQFCMPNAKLNDGCLVDRAKTDKQQQQIRHIWENKSFIDANRVFAQEIRISTIF